MYVVPELRQNDNTNDRYNSNSSTGNYKYQSLINSSLSASEGSLNTSGTDNPRFPNPNYMQIESRMVKSTSDQKIPETSKFIYVNKNGHAVESQMSPPTSRKANENPVKYIPKGNEVVCNAFLVELAKSGTDGYTQLNSAYQPLREERSNGRHVPAVGDDLDKSNNSSQLNNSLVTHQNNGGVRINTSFAVQEPTVQITYDHVKYINIFSLLCCWCFPFTGIFSVIYARITAKYYNMRDLDKAKKYLKMSEWFLIATFFFGFTLIAAGFAYMQHVYFTELKSKGFYRATSRYGFGNLPSIVPK